MSIARRLSAAVLAALMTLGLTACSGGEESSTAANSGLEDGVLILGNELPENQQQFFVCTSMRDGWTLSAWLSRDEVYAPAKAILNMLAYCLASTLIAGIAMTVFISGRLTGPLRELRHAMVRAGWGDLNANVHVKRKDEIALLARTYNRMLADTKEYIRENERNQRRQKELELKTLQYQINPHFLYNTLNTIKSLIEIDMNDTAVKAVSAMSSFYRNSLSKGQFIIPLRQELLLTEQYLYIQNLRYMDFVDYEITYEPSWEDHGAEIPKLTIQPVVENIFVHGLTSQICHIHLNVSIRNGTICISVSDNGSGIPPEKLAELNRSIRDFKTARHSFGLPSINHRIALLYGENYGLTIESSPEKGTTVTIVIPDKNLIEGEI